MTDVTRFAVVEAARRWVGTPYCHQASCLGAGADCLGLVRGVWRDIRGEEPEAPPAYTPDWGEADGDELLMRAALRHLDPVETPEIGDVLLFRMMARGPAKHLGVMSLDCPVAGKRMIHAYSGHGVCETALSGAWWRRIAGAFRFPQVQS